MARGRPSKKGEIAQAALRLFKVAGYQGTTIDQVVIEAGVSKPTVYSNYPSKLLLWQEVLNLIIESSEQEFVQLLSTLERENSGFAKGWVALWQNWVKSQDRLAVYRIHWGESHKLTDAEQSLFTRFESLLKTKLEAWMAHCSIPQGRYFALNAVAREACLISALSPVTCDDVELLGVIEALTQ